VFSILRSALLQPLPYRNPSELAVVSLGGPNQVSSGSRQTLKGRHALTSLMVLSLRRNTSDPRRSPLAAGEWGEVAALIPHGALDGLLDRRRRSLWLDVAHRRASQRWCVATTQRLS
jgi:hypothetical protein